MENTKKIRLSRPCVGEEEIEAIKKVMDTGCLAGTCEEVSKFEEEFASFVGTKYAVAASSCTTALHLAVLTAKHYNPEKKGKMVVPAYTFPATANVGIQSGLDLEIVDIHPDTWNMDIDTIKSRNISIIMPVHVFGNTSGIDEVIGYAVRKGSIVIEDAACALSAKYLGKQAGTIGDMGCYSFYPLKNICTGEGGMLVTDNEEYALYAKSMSDFGKINGDGGVGFKHVGYNYRMSSIQAAMGRVQLRKLPQMQEERKKIVNIYNEAILQGAGRFITTQYISPDAESSYQRYAIVLSNEFDVLRVRQEMLKKGVETSIGTHDLSTIPLYDQYHKGCRISNAISKQSLSLPLYAGMTEADIKQVLEVLKESLISAWKAWPV